MAGLCLERREWRVIFELATLDQNLLPLRLDVCQRVELVFERLSRSLRIEIYIVLCALVFDNYLYFLLVGGFDGLMLEYRHVELTWYGSHDGQDVKMLIPFLRVWYICARGKRVQ